MSSQFFHLMCSNQVSKPINRKKNPLIDSNSRRRCQLNEDQTVVNLVCLLIFNSYHLNKFTNSSCLLEIRKLGNTGQIRQITTFFHNIFLPSLLYLQVLGLLLPRYIQQKVGPKILGTIRGVWGLVETKSVNFVFNTIHDLKTLEPSLWESKEYRQNQSKSESEKNLKKYIARKNKY